MTPRSWITAGWVFVAAAVGLAIVAIVQARDAVNSPYGQRLVTYGLAPLSWQAAAAEFVRGIIYAVFAGVAFFSGLACFFWAAHRRTMEEITRIRQS
jgi:NhaP-type Na+/H+ or K+/H+ antiporter